MLERFLEAVLLCAFFSAAAYVTGRLLGAAAVSLIERNADVDTIRMVVARRSGLERGLSARVGDRRKAMAELDRNIKELVRHRSHLEQKATEALEMPDRILRTIGEPVKGAQYYLALVFNKYVSSAGVSKGAIDEAWAAAQEVEVWAKTLGEARVELERRYQESQGFKITSLVEPGREPVAFLED